MSNRGSFGAAGGTGGGGGDGAMTGNVYWSPAGNGNAETELEVAALCASGPKVIHLIDAGDVYVIEEDIDVNGSVFTAPNGDPSGRTLRISADVANLGGGQFQGQSFFGAVGVIFEEGGSVSWAGFPAMSFGGGSSVETAGSTPPMDIAAGAFAWFAISGGASVKAGTTPLVKLNDNGDVGSVLICSVTASPPGVIDQGWLSAGPLNTVYILNDGSFGFGEVGGWVGANTATINNNPYGSVGGSGPTVYQPSSGIFETAIGCTYVNTDLGKVTWWDGAVYQVLT